MDNISCQSNIGLGNLVQLELKMIRVIIMLIENSLVRE